RDASGWRRRHHRRDHLAWCQRHHKARRSAGRHSWSGRRRRPLSPGAQGRDLLSSPPRCAAHGGGRDTLTPVARQIIITSAPFDTRVALLEQRRLTEIFIERARDKGVAGNIYKGRVTRVLPGMQAAFVDIGLEKAAFLPGSDLYAELEDELIAEENA